MRLFLEGGREGGGEERFSALKVGQRNQYNNTHVTTDH